MNLVAVLAERARKHPERPALVDPSGKRERTLTYGELVQRVGAGAARLRATGLRRGGTILVFQPVSLELYEILLSAFHNGIRVMLADPSAGRPFLSLCCERLPPNAFFGPWKAQILRQFVPAMRRIPLAIRSAGWFPGTTAWCPAGPAAEAEDLPPDEPALITFTSGSTGVPKAAVRTHGFLLAQHAALASSLDHAEGEVDLITLPVFVLANLASGLTSVLADTDLRSPGKARSAAIREQSARHQVTRCAASPAFFEALLAEPSLPPFRKLHTGGAPVFPDLLERLRNGLPDAEIAAVFGSTEAEPMTHLAATDYTPELVALTAAGYGLCAGKPIPEIDLRILRDDWGTPLPELSEEEFLSRTLPARQVGEVVVTGEHVLPGYLGGIGDEETKIRVCGRIWHRTGDAGWLDEAGRLWLSGRCSAKLPAPPEPPADPPHGPLDYPFAIEAAIRVQFPDLRTAAIEWRGQRILAIERRAGTDKRRMIESLGKTLGIARIITLREIPLDRRHNAKIDYPALKRLLDNAR